MSFEKSIFSLKWARCYKKNVLHVLLSTVLVLLLTLSVALSTSYAAVADSYLPRHYDGYRAITNNHVVSITNGHTTTNDSTNYSWINGTEWINGIECLRSYSSPSGFNVGDATVSYISHEGSEARMYRTHYDSINTTYSPYLLYWKYGLDIGGSFSNNYSTSSTSDYGSYTATSTGATTLLGYESINTPYGYYSNCLKVRKQFSVTSYVSGYTSTADSQTIFWYADGIGAVKYFTEGDSWNTTVYYSTDVLSDPRPQPPLVSGVPAPNGQYSYSYPHTIDPVKDQSTVSNCKPFAIGDWVHGSLNLHIGLPAFSEGVDVYLGFQSDALGGELFLIDHNNNIQPASTILPAWKTNVSTSIDASLFGDLPISSIPKGIYNLYIAVTPNGDTSFNHYYLWYTVFENN